MYSVLDAESVDELTVPQTPADTPCVTEAAAPHTATADNIVDGKNQTSCPSNEAYIFQTNIEIIMCLHVTSNVLILANFFQVYQKFAQSSEKERNPCSSHPPSLTKVVAVIIKVVIHYQL